MGFKKTSEKIQILMWNQFMYPRACAHVYITCTVKATSGMLE